MGNTTIPAELVAINAIQGTLIADNAITSVHIAQNNVTAVQIAINAVTATQIADGTITSAKIADGTIVTADIADGQITTVKLADSTITSAKIASAAIGSGDIANNAILTQHIDDNQVTADQIADNAVGIGQLAGITRGSIIVGDSAGDPSLLGIGSSGHVLTSDGTDVAWTADTDLFLATTGGTITGNLVVSTTSPQLQFQTGASHYNWQIAAQENVNTGFEISSGAADADGTNDTYTPRLVILQSGNVGIGTSSPAQKLHVVGGEARFDDHISIQPTKKLYLDGGGDTYIDEVAANVIAFNGGGGERMRITTTGVGIGVTAPVHPLHLYAGSGGYYASMHMGNSTAGGTSPWLGLFNNISIANATYGWGWYDSDSDGSLQLWNKNNSTTGYDVMTFKRGGNVGIGTNNPSTILHLLDADYTTMSIQAGTTSHGAILNLGDSGDIDYGSITQFASSSGEGGRMRFIAGTTETMNLRGGNVGIGTNNPTARLDIRGAVNSEQAVFTGASNSGRGLSLQTAASGGQQDAGVVFDAQDTENGANPYIQLKVAGNDVAKFSKGSADKYSYSSAGIGGNGANLQLDGDDSEIRMANNFIHSDNSGFTKFTIRTGYGVASNSAELSLDGGYISFNTGSSFTERMRIEAGGNVVIGNTTSSGLSNSNDTYGHSFGGGQQVNSTNNDVCLLLNRSLGSGDMVIIRNNGSTIGSISQNGSTITYGGTSDYRLKENVTDMTNATTRLKQLKPKRFNYISDTSDTLVDGFLAHEVSSIVPEAIVGEKDAEDMQMMDNSKLVPLLVKTIQELEARITTLEG